MFSCMSVCVFQFAGRWLKVIASFAIEKSPWECYYIKPNEESEMNENPGWKKPIYTTEVNINDRLR